MPQSTLRQLLDALESRLSDSLAAAAGGLGEHQLLKEMQGEGLLPETPPGDDLALFRAHFLLFHALYRLGDRFLERRQGRLSVSALDIRLFPYQPGKAALAPADPLRDYYLDLDNLDLDAAQVEELLACFWQRLGAWERRGEALAVLGLAEPVDLATVRRRYRQLAMRHHPDRGGQTERLQEINRAMALLERCLSG